jgi:hypothetical protein
MLHTRHALKLLMLPLPHGCCRTDGALQQLKIKSVGDLAKWKYAAWADALVTLAEYEREDGGSR